MISEKLTHIKQSRIMYIEVYSSLCSSRCRRHVLPFTNMFLAVTYRRTLPCSEIELIAADYLRPPRSFCIARLLINTFRVFHECWNSLLRLYSSRRGWTKQLMTWPTTVQNSNSSVECLPCTGLNYAIWLQTVITDPEVNPTVGCRIREFGARKKARASRKPWLYINN